MSNLLSGWSLNGRVAKVGPNQTVTTTPRYHAGGATFKPSSRGQLRLSRPAHRDGFDRHSSHYSPLAEM